MKNKFGIKPLEIYQLEYQGVNAFLCVTLYDDENYVYVYELDTAPDEEKGYERVVFDYDQQKFFDKLPDDRWVVPPNANNSLESKALRARPMKFKNEFRLVIELSDNCKLVKTFSELAGAKCSLKKICDGSVKDLDRFIHTKFKCRLQVDEDLHLA